MEEPKQLIPRELLTEDEGLQELREKLAAGGKATETVISESMWDRLREREELRAEHEERMHRRWLGMALRNLLVWIAAAGAAVIVIADLAHRLWGHSK
jgi:hypothetical protein